jgi:hypothetical protein
LHLSPRQVLSDDDALPVERTVAVVEVVDRIRDEIRKRGVSTESFEENVGWEVGSALQDPERIWADWCADQLADVCAAIGIDWRAVIPA